MRVKRRIRLWVEGLYRYALKEMGPRMDTEEQKYAYGIVLAVSRVQGHMGMMTPAAMMDRYGSATASGYFDGLHVISEVLKCGVITPGMNEFENIFGIMLNSYLDDPSGSHIPS